MTAFNTLEVATDCPSCGHQTTFQIQFKYGDTWQFRYVIGQQLKWGGNDIGNAESAKVIVEGVSEPCPQCSKSCEFDILIEDNTIVGVKPAAPFSSP